MRPLRILIVDDEPLAHTRLINLLKKINEPETEVCAQAQTATEAQSLLLSTQPDVILLDIHMPAMDGMQWAHQLKTQNSSCQIIFVTASNEHAIDAFEVAATDYLTKPVRLERLQNALQKASLKLTQEQNNELQDKINDTLIIQDRGAVQRISVTDILFARAESKYITLHLQGGRNLLWDGSLNQLEETYPDYFLRTHRSILVKKQAIKQLKHCSLADGTDSWLVQLEGCDEQLSVSRRQLTNVRDSFQT